VGGATLGGVLAFLGPLQADLPILMGVPAIGGGFCSTLFCSSLLCCSTLLWNFDVQFILLCVTQCVTIVLLVTCGI